MAIIAQSHGTEARRATLNDTFGHARPPAEETPLFLSFPFVCPEPALVKCNQISIDR
jgi:hypothetical protein